MAKHLVVTMSDGTEWAIPARIIAANRATYYAKQDYAAQGRNEDEVYEEEFRIGMEDDDELLDWASNNMNWADVQAHARKVSDGAFDYNEDWPNADKEIVGLEGEEAGK